MYALWNSFLDTTNILELVNPTDQELVLDVKLYSLEGELAYRQQLTVEASRQFDLIVNDLPGFVKDSYGFVRIDFTGVLDGRASYYRSGMDRESFEFAYSVPFLNPTYGKTAVSFNTYQPSRNLDQAEDVVANWLTLVNLSSQPEAFAVNSFDGEGRVLRTKTITVPGFGRVDIDGGHGFAGRSVVGFHEVVPADPAAPYQAQLVRYGSNAAAEELPTNYSFAFPLIARAGNGQSMNLFVSANSDGEENWVELTNTRTSKVRVSLHYASAEGKAIRVDEVELQPHQQQHFNASAVLRDNGAFAGVVNIDAAAANAVVAQSMFYQRDEKDGGILAMYGAQAQEALGERIVGSYNLFLGMENWLKLANPTALAVDVVVKVSSPERTSEVRVRVPANSLVDLPIHNQRAVCSQPGNLWPGQRPGFPAAGSLCRTAQSSQS